MLEKLPSKRNKERRRSENNGEGGKKRFVQGVEKRASRRSRSGRRLGWLLSREQNCGCLSNPTDRNSISSCVSHLPRCVPSLFTSGYRRLALLSLHCPLALGHPPQLFLVDSYLFHSRHSHRVRDLSASPIGPQLTEISCGAPGRAAYVPSYPHTPTL